MPRDPIVLRAPVCTQFLAERVIDGCYVRSERRVCGELGPVVMNVLTAQQAYQCRDYSAFAEATDQRLPGRQITAEVLQIIGVVFVGLFKCAVNAFGENTGGVV